MVFFGDGATNEGAFHESLNMASIWKLPIVFVCENNKYGMSMDIARAMAVPNVADRAPAYAMPGVAVDGNDLPAVVAAARPAIERARSGGGPTLVECKTYRLRGHSKSDRNLYRTQGGDRGLARQRCDSPPRARAGRARPLRRSRIARDRAGGATDDRRCAGVRQGEPRPRSARADARRLCRLSVAAPEVGNAGIVVRRGDPRRPRAGDGGGRARLPVRRGRRRVRRRVRRLRRPRPRFGRERVIDTPISELGIAGAAVGAAITGMKPVLELQFSDFVTLAMEQIVNQAAKIHFMFGGKASVPMVVRLPGGSGTGAAAQHSQSLEAWFAHVPGLEGRAAVDAARRQGPAAGGDRRSEPGADLRAQAAVQDEGPGAGRALPRADRQGGGSPRRTRSHDRRQLDHGDTRRRGGRAARRRGHRRRGHRPALAAPDRSARRSPRACARRIGC